MLSENSEDKVSYYGRGFTRDSNEKVIIFKTILLLSGKQWYGWGIFSATADGLKYKNLTVSSAIPSDSVKYITPKGNDVLFSRLGGMFDSSINVDVVAAINGTEYNISETSFMTTDDKQEFDIQLFLLTMCDFYLF